MNKGLLVEKIVEGADITKSSAGRALNSLIQSVTDELSNGGEVGFGTYKVNDRAARTGRIPQTSAEIPKSAAKVPSFKESQALKEA